MPKYICQRCLKVFSQKSHYDKHLEKKNPCQNNKEKLELIVEEKVEKILENIISENKLNENKNEIINNKKINNMTEESKEKNILENYNNLDHNEIIELCKKINIPYLKNNKKPYSKIKLIKRIKKYNLNGKKYIPKEKKSKKVKNKKDHSNKVVKKEKQSKKKKSTKKKEPEIIDESYLRLAEYKTIFEFDNNLIKSQELYEENRNYILGRVDKLHNILYKYEQIEGVNAMNDVMSLIFLKIIQDKISDKEEEGKIDLKNKSKYRSRIVKNHIKLLDLDLLANDSENLRTTKKDATDNIRKLGLLLKSHPITGEIFDKENFLHVEESTTIQKMLKDVILELDVEKISETADAIGEIYEHFVSEYTGTNSKLSQYFTPRKMMFLILTFDKEYFIKKIEEAKKNGKNFSVYDPCMGTAGWLVIFLHMFQKYKDNLTFGGNEISKSTYMYALMNLVNALNKMPECVSRCNSLTSINTEEKYDVILQNPPFKTDVKFDIIEKIYKNNPENVLSEFDKIYHLKSNNPPIQFLELSIYKLKKGGICTIVLPYGSLFFSGSFKKAREYLLKSINIKRIVLAPSGVFTHTGVKTCIITFTKEKGTKEIKFMKTNKKCNKLETITKVSIEDIYKEPDMSLYHRDYLKDEFIENLMNTTNFNYDKFENIFELIKGNMASQKIKENINGNGVYVTQSQDKNYYKKTNDIILDGENIFIGNIDSGRNFCLIFYEGKCNYTNILSHCKIKQKYKDKINIKFAYYYLKSSKEYLTNEYLKGSSNLSLDKKNLKRILFPIPTLNIQNELVKRMELSDIELKQLNELKNTNLEKMKFYMELSVKNEIKKNNVIQKSLGEVCKFLPKGKRKSSEGLEYGKYPLYYCSVVKHLYFNDWNKDKDFDDEVITINLTNGGGKSKIFYVNGKYSICDSTWHFKSNDCNILNTKYLYHFLNINIKGLEFRYKGANQKSIKKENLCLIKIIIPSIEVQKDILKGIQKFENLNEIYEKNIKETHELVSNKFLEYFKSY